MAKEQPAAEEKQETEKEAPAWEPQHKYFDRLREYYPDRKYEKDEDVDSAFDEYLSDHESYRRRGDEANKALNKLMDSDPKLTAALRDAINNAVPFNVALAKYYGPDDFTLEEGDDHYADFDANRKAREESLAKQREATETFNKNLEESTKELESYMQDNQLTKETKDGIFEKFGNVMNEMTSGKFTKDTFDAIRRAVEFDKAVEEASDLGVKKGRNEKIVAEMEKEEGAKGDGLPAPTKGGEVKSGPQVSPLAKRFRRIADSAKERDPFKEE